jgi:uncharacterized protein YabN with tetrapyrrole methylase and pyrophosphatase domain
VYLYEEQRTLSLESVCDHINAKMIRRHPHVFGDHAVHSAQEVRDNWEKIKAEETTAKGKKTSLSDIPRTLPGLMRAHRILSRLAQQEVLWNNDASQIAQFEDLTQQMRKAHREGAKAPEEIYGQLLVSLTNLARLHGYRAEDCLHRALNGLVGEQAPSLAQRHDD